MTDSADARILVIMPTYNEAENLASIVTRTREIVPTAHILVVDDASPDGTGGLADELARREPAIHVLHRAGKQGLGAAYIAGFRWGLDQGFDLIIEMDADGSHPPLALPRMIEVATSPTAPGPVIGLVVGSRWVAGGSVENWPRHREILSRAANLYARLALGFAIHDSTAGYRVYRSEVLKEIDLSRVDSYGYCFQIDMTLRTLDAGFAVSEVPIRFRDRQFGSSKMNHSIVFEAMFRVTIWGITRRISRKRKVVRSARA